MKKKNNKRGVEMAMSTVVTLVIVLIVLVVISAFFLGGFQSGSGSLTGTSKDTGRDVSTIPGSLDNFKCDQACQAGGYGGGSHSESGTLDPCLCTDTAATRVPLP